MKKWFTYGAIFLSVYLVFAIALMPVNFVLNKVNLPKDVKILGAKGTIWNASIEEVIHPEIMLNNVNAQVDVLSIFTFNPQVDITFGDSFTNTPEGKLTLSGLFADLTIEDGIVLVPSNEIAQRLPLPIPLVTNGNVKLTINQFVLGKPVCQAADGNVSWSNTSISALNETVKLGDLIAKLDCKDGALAVELDDKNDLGVTFTAFVRANKVSGSGFLKPGAKFPSELKQALPFLGKPDNQGRYRLGF